MPGGRDRVIRRVAGRGLAGEPGGQTVGSLFPDRGGFRQDRRRSGRNVAKHMVLHHKNQFSKKVQIALSVLAWVFLSLIWGPGQAAPVWAAQDGPDRPAVGRAFVPPPMPAGNLRLAQGPGAGLPPASPAAPAVASAAETVTPAFDPGAILARMVTEAEKGEDPMLMLNVAYILIEGSRSAADQATGVGFIRRAAGAGLPYAMVELARMHTKGYADLVEPDHVSAYAWMKLALSRTLKENDKRDIVDMLVFMEKEFAEEDLAQGRERMQELDRTVPRLTSY